jgi:hypothetical protein
VFAQFAGLFDVFAGGTSVAASFFMSNSDFMLLSPSFAKTGPLKPLEKC